MRWLSPPAFADLLEQRFGHRLQPLTHLHSVDRLDGLVYRQRAEIGDRALADEHGEAFGSKPLTATGPAGAVAHELLDLAAATTSRILGVLALQDGNDALEVAAEPFVHEPALDRDLQRLAIGRAVEHQPAESLRQLAPRGLRLHVELVAQGAEEVFRIGGATPGSDGPARQRQVVVGRDELFVELEALPQSLAVRARPARAVERERPRHGLGDTDLAMRAREDLGIEVIVITQDVDDDHTVTHLHSLFDGIPQALLDPGPQDHPVDHDLDIVSLLSVKLRRSMDLQHPSVDAGANEAAARQPRELDLELSLAPPHDRPEDLQPGTLGQAHDLVDDLPGGLRSHCAAATGAMRCAHPGVQQAQVVVQLRHRPHGGARVAAGGFLLDGDRRRQTLDALHVGPLHLLEELPRVGRKRFDIASLPLGIERVEGERRLARSRQARHHDEAISRQLEVDGPQVVGAGTAHTDGVDDLRGFGCAHGIGRGAAGRVTRVDLPDIPLFIDIFSDSARSRCRRRRPTQPFPRRARRHRRARWECSAPPQTHRPPSGRATRLLE